MDLMKLWKQASGIVKRYRAAAFILLLGLLLLMLPSRSTKSVPQEQPIAESGKLTEEERLEQIPSCVQGAGKVKVMLTERLGPETVYQTDSDKTSGLDSGSEEKNTVIITDQNRTEQGLISQVNPPVYLGAIILCQGADSPTVRLAIVDAVSKITGLGSDKISVLKMK